MAIQIDPNIQPVDGQPMPFVSQSPSAVLVAAYAFPDYFSLLPSSGVNTLLIDFICPIDIGAAAVNNIVNEAAPALAGAGYDILAYGLFKDTTTDVVVPADICLFGFCFTPPFAGQTVGNIYSYRLWVLTQSTTRTASPQLIPIVPLGPLGILALAAAVVFVIGAVVAFVQILTGHLTFQQLSDYLNRVFRTPGDNVSSPIQALSWPLFALGFSVVAFSLLLPDLQRYGAQIGFQRAGFGVSAGVGQAPGLPAPPGVAPPARRQS